MIALSAQMSAAFQEIMDEVFNVTCLATMPPRLWQMKMIGLWSS
jgi:hypothetical protein